MSVLSSVSSRPSKASRVGSVGPRAVVAVLVAALTIAASPAADAQDGGSVAAPAPVSSGDWREHCPRPVPGAHRDHLGAAGNVALTFDDGPDPVYTPVILDVLAKHEVRATFFVVGRAVARHPELLQRIVDEGHLLGNHTVTHPTRPDGMDTFAVERRIWEVETATRMIQDAVGVTPCFFRGPQGMHVSPETVAIANERGMLVSGWSVSSKDYQQPTMHDEGYIAEMVHRTTVPRRERPVVLWHDSAAKPNTPPAVDRAISVYKQQGYGFVDPAGRPIPPVARELVELCPARLRLSTGFGDVSTGSTHRHAVMCSASRGIMSGRSAASFAPSESLTRGQFASMVDRTLGERELAPAPDAPVLSDVAGTTHGEAIERLAAAGLVGGRADGRFSPNEPVTRAQMASMLDRAITSGLGLDLPVSNPRFTDVDATSTHGASIGRLAGAGLVGGLDAGRYEPQRPVSRAQAASIMTRLEARFG